MKTYQACEFRDLTLEVKERVTKEMINSRVDFEIDFLTQDLRDGKIKDTEYYKALGCSKYYSESTSWFIPACYYEKHKKEVDLIVKEELRDSLFTSSGLVIGYK